MDDGELLRQVADRQAITDQIYRYCRAMDRIDPELGYSIWHEDGTADYTADVFQGSGRGFIDFVCEQHRQVLMHSHQVTNIIIDLYGDRAASEAYVTLHMRTESQGKLMQILVLSRYIDRWSKRDGRWAIDHRQTVMDFDEIREITELHRHTVARRDRSDPCYAPLQARG
jgi:hypothetical protein